jgi:hypothetical protein
MSLGLECESVTDENEIKLTTLSGGCDVFKGLQILATCRRTWVSPTCDMVSRSDRIHAQVHLLAIHMSFLGAGADQAKTLMPDIVTA